MKLYADSSALLAWLLSEAGSDLIPAILNATNVVIGSDLTLLECERTLVRAAVMEELPRSDINRRRAMLDTAAANWQILELDAEIWARAKLPFPHEPIRTLDALHLAFLWRAAQDVPDLQLLSLDKRMRASAQGLGIEVQPPELG